MTEKITLLLCTNGDSHTRPSLDYGVWLAEQFQLQVVLLGVIESAVQPANVHHLVDEYEALMTNRGIPVQASLSNGRASAVISDYAHTGRFLTVVGPLGRPAWRQIVQGRSFRRLLARIGTPMIYVPHVRLPLQKLLLCMGGLGFSLSMVEFGVYLAQKCAAEITLLHVVEPMNLNYPVARQVHDHWTEIIKSETPQGRSLRAGMEIVQRAGLEANFTVRHGNAVTVILNEIEAGKYDLLGLGSPYSVKSLRHMYLPNVTADVAETAGIPVLTARQGYSLI